jgi:hypothetical protein
MLLMILMDLRDEPIGQPEPPQPRNYLFIAVIFIAILIEVHANYTHDHGIDVFPCHPVVAKPAPP